MHLLLQTLLSKQTKVLKLLNTTLKKMKKFQWKQRKKFKASLARLLEEVKHLAAMEGVVE